VGRLVPRKGVGNVVSALALLTESGRADVELLVVGGAGGPSDGDHDEDPEVRRLHDLARTLGVEDRVHFLGQVPQPDLPAILRSVDVVVCAPWYEPFGIVPLEAMACGVPVVAATVGGLIDTVVDGATGVHVPPRDPEAIAAAVERLVAEPRTRRALGQAGRARVEARYSWDRVAAMTDKIYRTSVAALSADAAGAQASGLRRAEGTRR
jgi:glycosyltransferase involved in cell wall biosynthesis